MVEVILNDTGARLEVDGTLIFIRQVNDIGDITKANASYSWGFKFKKTPKNTQILKGLGLVGSTSEFPYKKIKVSILDNGMPITTTANLIVKATEKEYKAFVQDGIVDFFKEIKTDKIKDVVDLTEINHLTTYQNIIDSFTDTRYRYVIAYYNGKPEADISNTTNLNTTALIPSINLKYLFDKIMDAYGWTYSGTFDLSSSWMSYPNGGAFDDATLINILDDNVVAQQYISLGNDTEIEIENIVFDTDYINYANSNTETQIKETGNYRISIKALGDFYSEQDQSYIPYELLLKINGNVISVSQNGELKEIDIVLNQNDILQMVLGSSGDQGTFTIYSGFFKIDILNAQQIDFNSALIKLKVKDFFKEVMIRHSLIAFPNVEKKHIGFLTVDEKINAEVVDWSDKYVKRKSEKYVYNSYAKNNNFKHKYNDKEDDYADGVLIVENENLPIEKDLYKSITYAQEEDLAVFKDNGNDYYVPIFKMYNIEVKEDANAGTIEVKYKPLKDRFYIFTAETVTKNLYIIGQLINSFPIATVSGNTFKDIVAEKYQSINKIINETKIHEIELNLTKFDVMDLDLEKNYYFEQEQSVYILNKLKFTSGKLTTGEFIKIN